MQELHVNLPAPDGFPSLSIYLVEEREPSGRYSTLVKNHPDDVVIGDSKEGVTKILKTKD